MKPNRTEVTQKGGVVKFSARRRVNLPRSKWKRRFLDALVATGYVRQACKIASISRKSAYALRKKDPLFRALWDDAKQQFVERLEFECFRRAVWGVKRQVFYRGRPVMIPDEKDPSKQRPYFRRVYSDVLLIFLLQYLRPHKYRDVQSRTVSGPKGEPIALQVLRSSPQP